MQADRMASASCRPASMRTAIFPLKHLGVRPHTLRGRRCSATAGKALRLKAAALIRDNGLAASAQLPLHVTQHS